jgi:hypothetical protein
MNAGAVSLDKFMALSLTVLDRLRWTIRDLLVSAQLESWGAGVMEGCFTAFGC